MAEYIERQKVIDITAEMGALETQRRVQEIPAADVVEVVRCRECILHEDFMKDGLLYCNRSNSVVKPDGFCSYGKKDLEESK